MYHSQPKSDWYASEVHSDAVMKFEQTAWHVHAFVKPEHSDALMQ